MRRTEALASDAGLLIERRRALDGGVRLRERDIRGHSIPRRRIGNQAQSCIKRGTCVREWGGGSDSGGAGGGEIEVGCVGVIGGVVLGIRILVEVDDGGDGSEVNIDPQDKLV